MKSSINKLGVSGLWISRSLGASSHVFVLCQIPMTDIVTHPRVMASMKCQGYPYTVHASLQCPRTSCRHFHDTSRSSPHLMILGTPMPSCSVLSPSSYPCRSPSLRASSPHPTPYFRHIWYVSAKLTWAPCIRVETLRSIAATCLVESSCVV